MVRASVAGVVLILIVGAAAFYFYTTGSFPNLGSSRVGNGGTTQIPITSAQITIKSAQLQNGKNLAVDVLNNRQVSTKTIQALDACSPDFSICQGLLAEPVTFVLPSGSEYVENLTIPQCGFASGIEPCWGDPITGQTYYFKIQVTFNSGNPVNLNVAAKATGTY